MKGASEILIYGSNKFIEYIIFEHSLTYGILIIGNTNIFDHVISRYNKASGFIIHGDFNTFTYCYSYRNFDNDLDSTNVDGFGIDGEMCTILNNCFAWDNFNSGFNYYKRDNSSDLSYLNCGSRNNGNINVFTGKYDYDNGYPLEKKFMDHSKNY